MPSSWSSPTRAPAATPKRAARCSASARLATRSARRRAGFGPQLNGIVGRRAASTTDFKYSDALRRSSIVWSGASLAAFLKDPQRAVPGTKMRFWGLDDDRQLADLLAYLGTFP